MTPPDVLVIGAGPAGMAAAVAAGDAGAAVTLVDDGWLPGGQYLRQPPPQLRTGPRVPIIEAVQAHPRIARLQNSRVWAIERGHGTREHPHLLFARGRAEPIAAPRLILATGAHDRARRVAVSMGVAGAESVPVFRRTRAEIDADPNPTRKREGTQGLVGGVLRSDRKEI